MKNIEMANNRCQRDLKANENHWIKAWTALVQETGRKSTWHRLVVRQRGESLIFLHEIGNKDLRWEWGGQVGSYSSLTVLQITETDLLNASSPHFILKEYMYSLWQRLGRHYIQQRWCFHSEDLGNASSEIMPCTMVLSALRMYLIFDLDKIHLNQS